MNNRKPLTDFFFCSILFLLPFLHVNIGIGFADLGYNLANFEMFPNMNQMWMTATLVANVVGKIFTCLPFGHSMLGMNIYCTLLLSIISVVLYRVLIKDFSRYAVFCGLLLAICFSWAPKVTLYQYLSYYLFCASAVVLVRGLISRKRHMLFVAGILLGINLFVRFPNIVQTSLIVVVIYHSIISKSKAKELVLDLFACAGGYLAAALPIFGAVEIGFGIGSYATMIQSLFAMTDTATSYTPLSMLTGMYNAYLDNWKWFGLILIEALAALIIYGFLRGKWMKRIFYVIMGAAFLVILRIYWYWGVFNIKYTKYDSVYFLGVCFLWLTVLTMVGIIFLKNAGMEMRLYAMASFVMVLVTPLGSNNTVYSNFNNLYFVAPVLIGMVTSLFQKETVGNNKNRIWTLSYRPLGVISYMLIGIVLLQTFLFHTFFVFGDAGIGEGTKALVKENRILAGMITTEENAGKLETLTAFVEENDELREKGCIVWSHSPLLFYALELPCAISHTWPSLDSYSYDEFVKDMENLKEYPTIIYEAQYYSDLIKESPEWDKKSLLITAMLQDGEYQEIFRDDNYVICVPKKTK